MPTNQQTAGGSTSTLGGSTTGGSTTASGVRYAWWGKGVLLAAFYCDEVGGFTLSDQILNNTNNYTFGRTGSPTQDPNFYPFLKGEPISQVKVVVRYGPGSSMVGQVVPGSTFYTEPLQYAFYTGVNGMVFFHGIQPHINSQASWQPGFYIARFSILDAAGTEVEFQDVTFYMDGLSTNMENHIVKACFKKKPVVAPEDPKVAIPARWLIPLDQSQVINNIVQKTTYGLWPDDVANLTTYYNCTGSVDSPDVVLRISDGPCTSCVSDKLFDISYGDDLGSGSVDLGGNDYYTVVNAVYGQYRGLFLENANNTVQFDLSGSTVDHIYVINVKQDLLRDSIDLGTLELNIAHLSGSQYVAGGGSLSSHTGSNVTLAGNGAVTTLIESSRYLSPASYCGSGPIHYMVSGSLESGIYQESNPVIYGLFHPKIGAILLSGNMLDASASFGTVRSADASGSNPAKLLMAMSGAAQYSDASGDRLGFKGRSVQKDFNILTFIQVKHNDLNLTNNPTYVTDELGTINDDFINNPKVYITTIGLYNSNKELVAVGKISKPILRTGSDQAFFKVRLKQ